MALDRDYLKAKFVTGEYKSLKDFAEQEGVSYGYIQQLAAQGKWREEKTKKNSEIAKKITQKNIEEKSNDFIARQNDTLVLVAQAKRKVEDMLLKVKWASELNALVSTLYRCNEIERDLLGKDDGDTDGVVQIIDDIKGVGQEYVDDDEETDT